MKRTGLGIGAGLVAGLLAGTALAADVTHERLLNADKETGNWITVHRTLDGHRYSPLNQITKDNVKNLRPQTTYMLSSVTGGGRYEFGQLEGTPLAEDGFLYLTDGWGAVYKVDVRDPTKMKPVWKFDPAIDRAWAGDVACCGINNRGMGMWGKYIIHNALDGRMFAVDKETGAPAWEVTLADPAVAETITVAPLVTKNQAVTGIAGAEYGIRGFITAVDLTTGKQKWKFYTIPAKGEPGNETWTDNYNAWDRGGGSIWSTGTYDPKTDMQYWGTGNPAPQFDAEFRPGDNLYTDSVVALDNDTGKLKWYFQYTPNDPYDYDEIGHHPLVDVTIGGQTRTLVTHAARNGFMYGIDRTNGAFVYGEGYVSLITWTKGLDPKTGRPMSYDPRQQVQPYEPGTPGRRGGPAAVYCPALTGGVNWQPTAYNEKNFHLYTPQAEGCSSAVTVAQADFIDKGGTVKRRDRWVGKTDAPAGTQMPIMVTKGSIAMSDMRTGKVSKKLNLDYRMNGVLATTTGLVFGGNAAGELVAYDADTLDPLWMFNMGASIKAPPMTFLSGGKQYVAVYAGGKPTPAEINIRPELKHYYQSSMLYVFGL